MRSDHAIRAAALCGLAALGAPAAPSLARGQGQRVSLGEAARRLREQQKPAAHAAKVWTNEDIPKLPTFGVSVVGPPPESLTQETTKPATAGDAAKQITGVEAELAQEKARFAALSKELDLLQRELALDQQQLYSNPGYASDAQGKARLDGQSASIAAKRVEVQQSKDKVAELEAKLAKLKAAAPGMPTTPPAQPEKPQE